MEMMSSFTWFLSVQLFFSQLSLQQFTDQCTCNSTYDPDNDSSILAQEKSFHRHLVSSDHVPHVPCSQARQSYGERGLPGRRTIHWLRALMLGWRLGY